MRIVIDTDIIGKEGLTLEEFLILYLGMIDSDIPKCMNSLFERNLAFKDMFNDGKLILDSSMKEKLFSITIDSSRKVMDKEDYYLNLAKKLQELYPSGKKGGTNYTWRGTTTEIARKLKTLVVKYNFKFTEEQAINATKEYVQSFNGDYSRMRLLKYFILKLEKDADGNVNVISDFMSLIENEGQEYINNDWTTNCI